MMRNVFLKHIKRHLANTLKCIYKLKYQLLSKIKLIIVVFILKRHKFTLMKKNNQRVNAII